MSKVGIFNIENRFRAGIEEISGRWGWYFALGVLLIILGATCASYAFYTTVASMYVLGGILTGAGVLMSFLSFLSAKWSGFLLSLAMGILSIIVGVTLYREPLAAAVTLTLLVATLLLVGGIFRTVSAAIMRFPNWGYAAFSGLVSIFLGFSLFAGWPVISLWFLGFYVGIDLVVHGFSWCMFALSIRRIGHYVERDQIERPAA